MNESNPESNKPLERKRLDLGDLFSVDAGGSSTHLVVAVIEGSSTTVVRNLVPEDPSKVQYNTYVGGFTKLLKIKTGDSDITFLDPDTGIVYQDKNRTRKTGQSVPETVYL